MKKQTKKLKLAKETLRGLEKRDGLTHVAGGSFDTLGRQVTVETGCDFCETGSCQTCRTSCAETECF
jgi:hypothetical protein